MARRETESTEDNAIAGVREPTRPDRPASKDATVDSTDMAHGSNAAVGQDSLHIEFTPETRFRHDANLSPITGRNHSRLRIFNMQGVGAASEAASPRLSVGLEADEADSKSRREESLLSANEPLRLTLGRNSSFYNLSVTEREELGGAEYRAIRFLAVIVPAYFIIWLFLGAVGVGAWIAYHKADVTRSNGLNPWCVQDAARRTFSSLMQVGRGVQCGLCLWQFWHELTRRKHGRCRAGD